MKKFLTFGTSDSFELFYLLYVILLFIGSDFYDKEISNSSIFVLVFLTGILIRNKIEDSLENKL